MVKLKFHHLPRVEIPYSYPISLPFTPFPAAQRRALFSLTRSQPCRKYPIPMHDSRVIEVDGVFLGAAMALPDGEGWRIVAADVRVTRLNGTVTTSWQEAQKLARTAYFTWRPEVAGAA